jgi:pyruvate ferredoxin oxidoreductase gamma subunit/phenylglyoxylate dehydrogenase gamma subunit
MKEIRLHGRGGMGTVKAAEILVWAKVAEGGYGCSIPFFGFERQGAPVTAFVKLDDKPIRPKTQVYDPDCVIVLDTTIQNAVDVFEGMKEGSVFVLNTSEDVGSVRIPETVGKVATVNATDLALERFGRAITNTAMLGAFVKCTEWVSLDEVVTKVEEYWGKENATLVKEAYDLTRVREVHGKG